MEILGVLTDYNKIKSKKPGRDSAIIKIRLYFILKDWFGVDEGDVIKNEPAAQLARRELAALWVLQHQRNYPPFINVFKYAETI